MILRDRTVYRTLADGETSTTVELINASVSPVPLTPASISAMSTMYQQNPITIRNRVLFDNNVVNSIVSQQSATNATLTDVEKRARGILPGIAGATLQQVSRPGLQIKPGSDAFIQSKLNMGMKFDKAIGKNLLTGNMGARSVPDLLRNTQTQVAAVRAGLTVGATSLIKNGTITGLEPAAKIGGLVAAVGALGNKAIADLIKNPKNVVNILKGRGTELVGSITGQIAGIGKNLSQSINQITGNINNIKNMISSGNFASGIAEQFKSGVSGIVGGLAGALGGVIGKFAGRLFGKSENYSLSQLFDKLKVSSRAAYVKAKDSLGELKVGQNYTSGAESPVDASDSQRNMLKYLVAEMKRDVALDNLNDLKRELGNASDPESISKLRIAQNAYDSAVKEMQTVSSNIISPPATKSKGGIFGRIKGAISDVTDGGKGIFAIPGKVGAFANQVYTRGMDAYSTVLKASATLSAAYSTGGLSLLANNPLSNKLAKGVSDLANPTKLTGNLVKKTQDALVNTVGGKLGDASAQMAKLGTTLGSFGGSSGMIKTPSYAEGTDPVIVQATSKISECMGSDLVPLPIVCTGGPGTPSRTPNSSDSRLARARVSDLQAQYDIQELRVEKLYAETLQSPEDAGKIKQYEDSRKKLYALQDQINFAQTVYYDTIRAA